jgi:hypothetical protein
MVSDVAAELATVQPAGRVITIEPAVFAVPGEVQVPTNPVPSVTTGAATKVAAATGITTVTVLVATSAPVPEAVKPTVHVVTAPTAAEVGANVTAVTEAAPANWAVPSRATEATTAMATNLVTSLMGLRRDIMPCPVVE